ncbi:hypothetical protein VNI00_014159 [Paramarasmius palmivorus]|uniref:EF-hand domain-containing protein n=1 Tax=Paramarasmius palmivorus TaxID=297713 RepID=A0AAW0BT70_9AGAR
MEEALNKVNKLIAEEGASSKRKTKEKSNQRTRKILEYIQQGVAFADAIAGMNDYAGVAVKTLAKLLECEIARRKNSEEFVVVYQAFASTMFLVRYLEQADMEDIQGELDHCFDEMNNIMQDFGVSAEVYYTKCRRAFVRFLKAKAFEEELKGFTERAYEIQERIQSALSSYTAVTVAATSEDIKRILSIVSNLPKATTKQEKDAEKIIQEAGDIEDVDMNDATIAAIAKVFGDRVTSETKVILHQDLHELLEKHRENFITKLNEATLTISTKIEGFQGEVMRKLNSGPHNLIDNEEFKKMWQDLVSSMAGKPALKASYLLMASNNVNTFAEQNGNEHFPRDNWTLSVFTYVMFHPAIGDAIDDDGSGYVSVREFNNFLKHKPEGWTVPELFAFWALGWQVSVYNTSFEIAELVWEIEEVALTAKAETQEGDVVAAIEAYLRVLNALLDITRWSTATGYDETFTEDVPYNHEEMERLTEEYATSNQELFHEVTGDDGIIEEYSSLDGLTPRFGSRVELWFIPLVLEVLQSQLHKLLGEDDSAPRNAAHINDDEWFYMCFTLELLLFEFHTRMKNLLRGWHVQKLDSRLQVNSFFGGLFAGWFEAYASGSNKKVIAQLESLEESLEEDEPEEDGSTPEAPDLVALVSDLQESVKHLTAMVQSLLEKQATPATNDRQPTYQANTRGDNMQAYQNNRRGQYSNSGNGQDSDSNGDGDDDGEYNDDDEGSYGGTRQYSGTYTGNEDDY